MKPKEAIDTLKALCAAVEWDFPLDYAAAIDEAIEALEKQIPKAPVIDYGFPEKTRQAMMRNGDTEKAEYKTDCCPVCKKVLGVSKFVQSKTGLRFGDLYCKHCGQAILWESEQDET